MEKKRIKWLLLSILCLLMLDCSEPVDFEQTDDLSLVPVIESSLFFYEGTAGNFFLGGAGTISTPPETIELGIFKDDFVQENLVKAEFVFESTNSINRAYSLEVNFLNDNNVLLHSLTINTPASPDREKLLIEYIETFEGITLERLKQSTKVVSVLTMLAGEAISQNSPGEISLKSKGVFYLELNP